MTGKLNRNFSLESKCTVRSRLTVELCDTLCWSLPGFVPRKVKYVLPFQLQNRDTAVPAEGNCDLQTLICVLVARPRRCPILSNPVQCPLTKLNGSLSPLYSADEDAVSWLTSYGS